MSSCQVRERLACLASATNYLITGRASRICEGERRPAPFLFSPCTSSSSVLNRNGACMKTRTVPMSLSLFFSFAMFLIYQLQQLNKIIEKIYLNFIFINHAIVLVSQPVQQAFLCAFGAKNEERESKTARKKAVVLLFARLKPIIPFLVIPRSFFAPKSSGNACYAGYGFLSFLVLCLVLSFGRHKTNGIRARRDFG